MTTLAGVRGRTLLRCTWAVPVFAVRDGVRMPVGYRPCDCVAEA